MPLRLLRHINPLPKEDDTNVGLKRLPLKLQSIDKELEKTVEAVERGDVDLADLDWEEEFGPVSPVPVGKKRR